MVKKSSFGGSPQIFINISVCKSSNQMNILEFTSHIIVNSTNEKDLLSDIVGAIGLFDAADIDLLLILSRNDFKGPLNVIIIFNLEV